jgi:hypothetical protein
LENRRKWEILYKKAEHTMFDDTGGYDLLVLSSFMFYHVVTSFLQAKDMTLLQQWSSPVFFWLVVWNMFPYIGNNHPN